MINSFYDKRTEKIYNNKRVKGFPTELNRIALRKLDMLRRAVALEDLRSPPGNRLEALKGNLKGLHRIRINDQWRIVFKWTGENAEEVRIVDYH